MTRLEDIASGIYIFDVLVGTGNPYMLIRRVPNRTHKSMIKIDYGNQSSDEYSISEVFQNKY